MKWLNEPKAWTWTDSVLSVTTDSKTDFWRLTHDGGIRDNGHFYYEEIQGDFQAQVCVEGQYREQYDQSGLMLRLNELHWIKCGIEWVDGHPLVSAVVTGNTSDWSVLQAPQTPSLTFRIQRTDSLVEIFYGRSPDNMTRYRQTSFPSEGPVAVGPMTASPLGAGFPSRFTGWTLEQ